MQSWGFWEVALVLIHNVKHLPFWKKKKREEEEDTTIMNLFKVVKKPPGSEVMCMKVKLVYMFLFVYLFLHKRVVESDCMAPTIISLRCVKLH